MDRQDERRSRRLTEVEVVDQVAEDLRGFADIGSWVRSAVGRWVEALAAQEGILDELVEGVEAQRLVVDIAPLGIGADDERRYAQPVAVRVDRRRGEMVVEAAAVVPGQQNW